MWQLLIGSWVREAHENERINQSGGDNLQSKIESYKSYWRCHYIVETHIIINYLYSFAEKNAVENRHNVKEQHKEDQTQRGKPEKQHGPSTHFAAESDPDVTYYEE